MATIQAKSVRRREDPRLLTGQGNYAADATPAEHRRRDLPPFPSRPRPHRRNRPNPRPNHPRRHRRLHRRRPDGCRSDSRRHRLSPPRRRPRAEDRPPAAGRRSSALRRRTGGPDHRRHPRRRPGSRRGDRRRLRRPAGRHRAHRGACVGRSQRSGTTFPTISASCGSAATRTAPPPLWPDRPTSPTLDFTVSRVTANSMEPRGAWAQIAADGRIELHASHQSPFALRNGWPSGNFQIPPTDIRVLPGDVGGSFGMKVRRASGVRAGRLGRAPAEPSGALDRRSHRGLSDRRTGPRNAHHRLARAGCGRKIHRAEAALGCEPGCLRLGPLRLGRRQYRRHRRGLRSSRSSPLRCAAC